jgi:hypothetical protein
LRNSEAIPVSNEREKRKENYCVSASAAMEEKKLPVYPREINNEITDKKIIKKSRNIYQ